MITGSFFIDDKGNKVEVVDAKAREELKSQKGANAAQDEAIDKRLKASELPTAINTALEQAKASGEFKGDPGEPGYTPQKGVDYFDGKDGEPGAPGEPGKDYVLTEADKEEIAEMAAEKVEVPEGGGSYTLPVASPSQLGGVKPAAKTDEMTQAVGVDEEGKLWGLPSGSGGEEWRLAAEYTLEEDVASILWTQESPVKEIFAGFKGVVNNEANDASNAVAATYVRSIDANGKWSDNLWTNRGFFYVRTGGYFSSALYLVRRGCFTWADGILGEKIEGNSAYQRQSGFLKTDNLCGFIVALNDSNLRAKAGMMIEVYVR